MNNHTDLLNYLVKGYELSSYLEIGVQNTVNNFDKIQCERKYGVDPDLPRAYENIYSGTSDQFFHNYTKTFDLIFIDGLHHADQVKRDFENSLKHLTDKGFIVMHDTNPDKEMYTHVPRDSKIWYGDVYKFACKLGKYDGIDFRTLPFDCGCTVVWKDKSKSGVSVDIDITWDEFVIYKNRLLNFDTNLDFKL